MTSLLEEFVCNKCGTKHKIYGDLKKGICIGCDEAFPDEVKK